MNMKYLEKLINRIVLKISVCLPLCLLPGTSVFAERSKHGASASLGDVASNIFGIEMNVREIVKVICIVAGVSLILGSLLQYKKYRQNPVATRLSSVIFTFVVGACLILLSFIPIQLD